MKLFKLLDEKFNKYIDFSDFDNYLLIECKTLDKAHNLCKALDKLGLKWCNGNPLTEDMPLIDEWGRYKVEGKGGFYIFLDFDFVAEALVTMEEGYGYECMVYTLFNDSSDFEYDRDYSKNEPVHLTYEKAMNIFKEIRRELRQ